MVARVLPLALLFAGAAQAQVQVEARRTGTAPAAQVAGRVVQGIQGVIQGIAGGNSADDMLRRWYRHFLGRPITASGYSYWMDKFRQGRSAADVLLGIVASDEYFQRVGRNDERFVQVLYWHLTGEQAEPELVRRYLDLGRRNGDRVAIARAMLQQHGRRWYAGDAAEEDNRPQPDLDFYRENAEQQAAELAAALGRLQSGLVTDLQGASGWQLYRQLDGIQTDLSTLRQQLRNLPAERTRGLFANLDRQLHEMLETADRVAQQRGDLRWAVAQVRQADDRLHYTLYGADPDHRDEAVRRQLRALTEAAQAMDRTAQYVAANDQAGRELETSIAAFAHRTEELAETDDPASAFGRVGDTWARVVRDLNGAGRRQGYYYLDSQARSIERILDGLRTSLQVRAPLQPVPFRGYETSARR